MENKTESQENNTDIDALEPFDGEIEPISMEKRTMRMVGEGSGDAIWVKFDLLYRCVVTLRKMRGHTGIPGQEEQDAELLGVSYRIPWGPDEEAGETEPPPSKILPSIPRYLKPGEWSFIVSSPGATSVGIEVHLRVENSPDEVQRSAKAVEMLKKMESKSGGPTPSILPPGEILDVSVVPEYLRKSADEQMAKMHQELQDGLDVVDGEPAGGAD